MKVKLLFFFSFVLVSAALVQHGAKLSLSNKVEGSENTCCCIMRFVEKSFFMATSFVAESIYASSHHVSFKCISSHFIKVSRGSMLRTNPPSWLTLTRSKWAPPHPSIANLLRNSVSDNQSSSPRDLPLRPHLVRLLVGSHRPLKQPGYVPGSSYDLFHLTGNFLYCSFNRRCDWEIKAAKISHTYIHDLYFTSNLQSSSKANIFEKRKKW